MHPVFRIEEHEIMDELIAFYCKLLGVDWSYSVSWIELGFTCRSRRVLFSTLPFI